MERYRHSIHHYTRWALALAIFCLGAAPSRPYTYSTGAQISSSENNANENTLYNYLQAGVEVYKDDTIVNADINSSAAIESSKLNLTSVSDIYLQAPIADVRAYGAVGDGSSDDTASIQDAINAVNTAGGGVVYLPEGTYKITSELAAKSEVSIIGAGADATTIEMVDTGSALNMINLSQASDLIIAGIKFYTDGTKTSNVYAIHEGTSGSNVTVRDCWFEGLASGVKIDTDSCFNYQILNCRFDDVVNQDGGAVFTNGIGTVVDGCYFSDIGSAKTHHAVYPGPSNLYTKVSNSHMVTGEGYLVSNGNPYGPTEVTNCTAKSVFGGVSGRVNASNVTIYDQDDASGSGFYLGNQSTLINSQVIGHSGRAVAVDDTNIVAGCVFRSNATNYGIGVETKGTVDESTMLANNVFQGTSAAATTVANYITTTTGHGYITWIGNTFWDTATDNVITCPSDGHRFVNNYFYSSDANNFHDTLITVTGNSIVIKGNQAFYLTNTPTDTFKTSGQTDAEAQKTWFEDNIYLGTGQSWPTIASANDMRIDSNTYAAYVSGTTNINTITGTVRKRGRILTLQFAGSLTLKHNTAGSGAKLLLKGAADVSVTAGDVIQLIFTGTTWYQASEVVAN